MFFMQIICSSTTFILHRNKILQFAIICHKATLVVLYNLNPTINYFPFFLLPRAKNIHILKLISFKHNLLQLF